MLFRIEGTKFLAKQIYQSIRSAILSGELREGSRLPATRALMRDLNVSRNTVLSSYGQLLAEGYVVGRVGSGTYVTPALPNPTLRSKAAGRPRPATDIAGPRLSAYGQRLHDESIAPLWTLGQSHGLLYDFRYGVPAVEEFPHELWRRLLMRRARAASVRSLGYGPQEGYGPLREAIADYVQRVRGVVCEPEQVLVVNGSQQALDLAARVLLDPGDCVAIEEPHYPGARRVFLAAGARLVPALVDSEGLNVDTLRRSALSARLAYVTPSHQFPSGVILSLRRRLALLAWAEDNHTYVFEDDFDSEYRYGGPPVEALQGLDRADLVIYAGTFSKVLSPAFRLGYLVLPEQLVRPFRVAKWLADRHTPTLWQEVLTDFIREGHLERHIRRSRVRNAARRAALLEAVEHHLREYVEVVGANAGEHLVAWLREVERGELDELVREAARVGVGVYPIAPYYLEPPPRAGLLLGYAAMREVDIDAGIHRLASVLSERRWAQNAIRPRRASD
jgi:GntR family transcriptional regulator/MocR family aminotransferase